MNKLSSALIAFIGLSAFPAFGAPNLAGDYVCLEKAKPFQARVETNAVGIANDGQGGLALKYLNNGNRPGYLQLTCGKDKDSSGTEITGKCNLNKIETTYAGNSGYTLTISRITKSKIEIKSTIVNEGKVEIFESRTCLKTDLF